jgi:hypothetical protein
MDTPFDRYEKMFLGPDGETTTQWTRIILSDLLKLQRSAIMSATAMERTKTLIIAAITKLDKIPHDVSLPMHRALVAAASTSSTPSIHHKGQLQKYAGMITDIPQPHF